MKQDDKDKTNSKLNSLEELPELKEDLSSITATTKQKFLIWSILGLIASYLLFYYFLSKKSAPQNTIISDKNNISNPNITKPIELSDDVPIIPELPSVPKIDQPNLPTQVNSTSSPHTITEKIISPPTPNITINVPSNTVDNMRLPAKVISLDQNNNEQLDAQKRKEAKRTSAIMFLTGAPIPKPPHQIQQEADFVNRGNTALLLPRGKIIEAVVETAINSDFGGEVKAIISRDVYAASGNRVLIPKGSIVFGNYNSSFQSPYARIEVAWNRIDLAHSNYSINISSPSIDNLGRPGVSGVMDNKYKEKMTNVVLASAFNIMLAGALDKMIPPVVNSVIGTGNQTSATQINNIAANIFSGSSNTVQKINDICSQVQAAIIDKTSTSYVTFTATCTTVQNDVIAHPENAVNDLNNIMVAVYTAAASLVTTGGFVNPQIMTTPTQKQQASKQAFNDVSSTVRDMLIQQLPKTTVTVEHGTHIKIYVTKDYNFPKAALSKITRVNCE